MRVANKRRATRSERNRKAGEIIFEERSISDKY
jgi:hypothetical protein